MTSPELLRFFHAEAREYLDAVEGLVQSEASFEAGSFVAAARALRGSATMARVPRISELALAMERLANAVRDGEIEWTANLRRDLGDTVVELRRLVATTNNWTADDERRASDRLAALRAVLPAGVKTPASPAAAGTTPIFIALQASAIAADLEKFLLNPLDRALIDDVVNRLKSLRGIAGVADHPPLGEVADAVERALRELAPDALLSTADMELLTSAAGVFRRASSGLRAHGQFERTSSEVDRFARAAAASASPPTQGEAPIVQIEELFFTDAGPHLVQRGTAPSRSAEARFREDVVTRAEHLRRLVAEARVAMDPFTRERVRRDLKAHLARLDEFARSYGAQQVASVVGEAAALDSFTDEAVLDAVEAVGRILATPGIALDEMERRLAVDERKRWTPAAPSPAVPVLTPTPLAQQATSPSRSGRALQDMLGQSLSQLSSLENIPMAEPLRVDDDTIVPVESLLFRGPAALERARALRDDMRRRGTVDPDELQELYELLDLARAE